MNARVTLVGLKLAATAVVAMALAGCTYDYMQHTDKVSYSHGDAVKANLEMQTVNPGGSSRYNTSGLGANGDVIPAPTQ